MTPGFPPKLFLVRHGQSAGNVARDLAESRGLTDIDIEAKRDMDVPLSPLGEEQALALAHWFRDLNAEELPTLILCSPYLRAQQTAETIVEAIQEKVPKARLKLDERLREREFGVIDRLTKKGIETKFPEQAEMYARLNKFYYRPPGGENWCDVILRLRSIVHSLETEYVDDRVLVVCHSAVIFCFRYLLENMTEQQILEIQSRGDVANCSVTTYRNKGKDGEIDLRLENYNFVAPLKEAGAAVTSKSDVPRAPK